MSDELDIDREWELEQASFRGHSDAIFARIQLLHALAQKTDNNPQPYLDGEPV